MTCKLIEVIQAYVTQGRGTPDNPYRTVTQFWSKDGELLAENDPHPSSSQSVIGGPNVDAS